MLNNWFQHVYIMILMANICYYKEFYFYHYHYDYYNYHHDCIRFAEQYIFFQLYLKVMFMIDMWGWQRPPQLIDSVTPETSDELHKYSISPSVRKSNSHQTGNATIKMADLQLLTLTSAPPIQKLLSQSGWVVFSIAIVTRLGPLRKTTLAGKGLWELYLSVLMCEWNSWSEGAQGGQHCQAFDKVRKATSTRDRERLRWLIYMRVIFS